MCEKKQSRAPVPLLHPPYVSTPRQIPSHVCTTMLKVLSYVGDAAPRKEAAPEVPTNRRPGERGLFKRFPAEKVQVAAAHWPGWAVGGPGWVWRCWSSQGPGAPFAEGLPCWHQPPTASASDCPALASGLFELQKCVSRPGARDLRAITLAFCFFF